MPPYIRSIVKAGLELGIYCTAEELAADIRHVLQTATRTLTPFSKLQLVTIRHAPKL